MAVKTTKEYADRMKMAGDAAKQLFTSNHKNVVLNHHGNRYVVRVLPAEPTMQVVIEHDSGVVSTVEFGPLDSKETRVAFILRLVENKVNYSVNFSKE